MEFREFLNKLEEMGELKRVKREVDPRFEICAIMKKVDREKGPAILCEKAKGYPQMSVAGNLFATERRIALGIGAKEADIAAVPAGDIIPDIIAPIHTKAKDELKPCQMVSSGAVREVVVTKDIDVMKAVPVPTHCEKDGGPYIAAGVVVAKHPDTGDRVTQVIEIMVKGPDKLTIAPATPMMPQAYARAEELNQPFEVAIVIGVAPAIMYAACATAGLLALDKFELAGALQGRGVDLVKCETVDLEVPADAEFVIEGKMPPKVREEMGP
jgi:2,5-furandicarboxylate decarboxylase 1